MKNYVFDGHKLIYHLDRVAEFVEKGDCFPLYVEISPVGSCNHRCLFCAYDFIGHPSRELHSPRVFTFIDELAECGVRSILFSGEGEPLLHPDAADFIVHAKKRGIDAGLYTNGHLMSKDMAEKVLPALTFVRISFNGGTRENYSAIHGVKPEVFDRVVENVRTASELKVKSELNVDIGAQFVLLPENIEHLTEAAATMKEAGIDYFAIKPFVQQSSLQGYTMGQQFGLGEIEGVLKEAESLSTGDFRVVARRDSFSTYGERNYMRCYGTSFISAVNSAGDVASCLPYWDKEDFVFGNIYKNGFREIWQGERRRGIKRRLEDTLDAGACPPNCRPNTINEFLYEIKNPRVRHRNFI
jgi:MoaA/NifB/PqqE/SkfB family radical SAM enzyme